MWYQILPTAAIIFACMAAPHYLAYGLNWVIAGNCYRRSLMDRDLRLQYLRDIRLTGDAYITAGLENISNDDEECPDDEPEETCED